MYISGWYAIKLIEYFALVFFTYADTVISNNNFNTIFGIVRGDIYRGQSFLRTFPELGMELGFVAARVRRFG